MNDAARLGALPTWDLADLYPGTESPELAGDLEAAAAEAETFAAQYEGGLAALDGAALGKAVAEYERQEERLGRIMSFAHLLYAGDITNPETGRFFQTMQEKVNAVVSVLLFFELE
ncbi:MAG: hypothetical protein VW709_03735, partial [Rickettsiales bacterium]